MCGVGGGGLASLGGCRWGTAHPGPEACVALQRLYARQGIHLPGDRLDNTRPSAEDIREDHSGATYQLPQSISVGSTLKEANAVLAPGKGRQDIAGSELFAGSLPLRLEDFVKGRPVIDLYRRVAGVMGYFVNIPATIEGRKVGALQVRLYTGQNTRVPLRKVPYNGSLFSDYITSPMASDAGGRCWWKFPLRSSPVPRPW